MIFYDFTKSPTELVDYLKDKKPELHFDYDEIMHSAHHKTFTVAFLHAEQLDNRAQIELVGINR